MMRMHEQAANLPKPSEENAGTAANHNVGLLPAKTHQGTAASQGHIQELLSINETNPRVAAHQKNKSYNCCQSGR
jgi:hypothetical protein